MGQARSNAIRVTSAELGVLYTIRDSSFPGWWKRANECVVCVQRSTRYSWPKFLTKRGVEELLGYDKVLLKVETK